MQDTVTRDTISSSDAAERGGVSGPTIDPVTLEVINNRIDEAVREMQHVMFRTGYSTIIRDSKDGSAGVCLPDGRVIGQAFRLPLHCGVFPPTIEGVRDAFGDDDIEPGDVFVANDPYLVGANHSPDLLVVRPVFAEGELQAFCTNIAHKPDVGGLVPGTSSPDAREIYHEGLLLPPVKFHRAGEVATDIERIIRNNSRTPDVTMGDVRGQVGCTEVGEEKLHAIFDDYGAGTVQAAAEELIASTRARLVRELREWDGSVAVTGQLDADSVDEEAIELALTIRTAAGEESLTFDFTGSADQSEGPANMQPHVVRSACYYALVGVIDPTLSLDGGVSEVCEFVLPEGTIVHPRRPAPCNNYSKGMAEVVHLALRALSEFAPGGAVAETGGKMSIAVGSRTGEDDFVHYEIMGSGFGGHAADDGANCMGSSYESNPELASLEIIETEFEDRVTEFSVRPDSAGAGRYRGGVGFVREYEALAPLQFTYRGSKHQTEARGVDGGRGPGNARASLRRPDGTSTSMHATDTVTMERGDRVRIVRPGGAGYGDPFERDPERVLADVRDGFVSVRAAREAYGVVVRETDTGCELDEAATRERRS